MLAKFFETDRDRRSFLQRVLLGGVMLPHGAQKLLGWFGNAGGVHATLDYFTQTLHIPSALAWLVVISEAFGSIALLLGLCTRLAAFGSAATMLGAVLITHAQFGFFMNWFGNRGGEGFEYHLLALGLALPLLARGGGAWSLDRVIHSAVAGRSLIEPTPAQQAS